MEKKNFFRSGEKLSVSSISYQDLVKYSSSCNTSLNSYIEELNTQEIEIDEDVAKFIEICQKLTKDNNQDQVSENNEWVEINKKLENLKIHQIKLSKTIRPKYESLTIAVKELLNKISNDNIFITNLGRENKKLLQEIKTLKKQENFGFSQTSPIPITCSISNSKEFSNVMRHCRETSTSLKNFSYKNRNIKNTFKNEDFVKGKIETQKILMLLSARDLEEAIGNIKKMQKVILSVPILEKSIEKIYKILYPEKNIEKNLFALIDAIINKLQIRKMT